MTGALCAVTLDESKQPDSSLQALQSHSLVPFLCSFYILCSGDFQNISRVWGFIRICIPTILRACECQAERSCVKLTVCDSWGPQTEPRWRGEIRYFPSLGLHYVLYICTYTSVHLSHLFTDNIHIPTDTNSLAFVISLWNPSKTRKPTQRCHFLLNILQDFSNPCSIKYTNYLLDISTYTTPIPCNILL